MDEDWEFPEIDERWLVQIKNTNTGKIITIEVKASNRQDAFNKARATRGKAAENYAEQHAAKIYAT